jgi:hypothetical protein
MAKSLQGEVPGVSLTLAKNKLAEALGKVYDESDWSFQTGFAGWLAPGNKANTGTFTVTPYQTTVIADATASAVLSAWSAPPLLTLLQYRDPARAIYNIIGVGSADTVAYLTTLTAGSGQTPGTYVVNAVGTPGSGAQASIVVGSGGTVTAAPTVISSGSGYTSAPTFTLVAGGVPATFSATLNVMLTLDRMWMEPTSGPGQPYMIYQAYFAAPVKDFRKFIEVRDTTNARRLNYWSFSQADLAREDPQRTCFADPRYVVPCGVDTRPGSSTQGYPMFELWPQQLSYVPYSFSYRRRGQELVNPLDTVPYPLTEELVMHRAKEVLYLFKEAQKGEDMQRGSGANWLLLAQAAKSEYDDILDKIRAIDANLHNDFLTHVERYFGDGEAYSNRLGGLNIGGYPGRM